MLAALIVLWIVSTSAVTVISSGYSIEASSFVLVASSTYLRRVLKRLPSPTVVNLDLDESLPFHPTEEGMRFFEKAIAVPVNIEHPPSTQEELFELCKTAKALGSWAMYYELARGFSAFRDFSVVDMFESVLASEDRHVLPAIFLYGREIEFLFGKATIDELHHQAVITNDVDLARAICWSFGGFCKSQLYAPLIFALGNIELSSHLRGTSPLEWASMVKHGHLPIVEHYNLENQGFQLARAAVSSGDIQTLAAVVKYHPKVVFTELSSCGSREMFEYIYSTEQGSASSTVPLDHHTTIRLLYDNAIKKGWTGIVASLKERFPVEGGNLVDAVKGNHQGIVRMLLDSNSHELTSSLLSTCVDNGFTRIARWLVLESVDTAVLDSSQLDLLDDMLYPGFENPKDRIATVILRSSTADDSVLMDNSQDFRVVDTVHEFQFEASLLVLDSEYFAASFRSGMVEVHNLEFILDAFPVEQSMLFIQLLQDPFTSFDDRVLDLMNDILPLYLYFHSDVVSRFIVRYLRDSPEFWSDPYPHFSSLEPYPTVIPLLMEALGTFDTAAVFKTAITTGDIAVVEALLSAGIDPSAELTSKSIHLFDGASFLDVLFPLEYSILHQHDEVFLSLVNHKNTNPSIVALYLAVFVQKPMYVENLLSASAPDARSQVEGYDPTPLLEIDPALLTIAIEIGNIEILRLLVSFNSGTCEVNKQEFPVYFATTEATVDYLLSVPQCSTDHSSNDHDSRLKVMHHLAQNGYDRALRRLIKEPNFTDADVHSIIYTGHNYKPLMHPRVLELLIELGCELTDESMTLLLKYGFSDPNSVRLLVETGMPLDLSPRHASQVVSTMQKFFDPDFSLPHPSE